MGTLIQWLPTITSFLSFPFSLSLLGSLTPFDYFFLSHNSFLSYPRLACYKFSLFFVSFLPMNKHPFHIVSPSPWPIFVAGSLLLTVPLFIFSWSHIGGSRVLLGLVPLLVSITLWFRDVIHEAYILGCHTSSVQY